MEVHKIQPTDRKQFQVGVTYYARFTCDYDTIAYCTVVRRTDKSVWVQTQFDGIVRRSIRTSTLGESFRDGTLGFYSHYPAIDLDRDKDFECDSREEASKAATALATFHADRIASRPAYITQQEVMSQFVVQLESGPWTVMQRRMWTMDNGEWNKTEWEIATRGQVEDAEEGF